MGRLLKIDSDGRLKLPETDVEGTVIDFLAARGWDAIPTRAEAQMPGGRRQAHPPGHSDFVMVHPSRPAFFLELKARKARTKAARRSAQEAFAEDMARKGYAAYRAADKDPDPIVSFIAWYERTIK